MNANVTARLLRSIPIAAAVLLSGAALNVSSAQFGGGFPGGRMNLPQDDFTWTWGNQRNRRDFGDISVLGNQGGFRCELTAKLGISSRLSRFEIRDLESELRSSMRFVEGAARMMNRLDAQGDLDWAVLDCVLPDRD